MYIFTYILNIYIYIELPIEVEFFLGTSSKRRNELIRDLNEMYQKQISTISKQDLAYKVMVEKYPPRFLSGFTYEEDPQPLRSQRIAIPPVETDVIINFTRNCLLFFIQVLITFFNRPLKTILRSHLRTKFSEMI